MPDSETMGQCSRNHEVHFGVRFAGPVVLPRGSQVCKLVHQPKQEMLGQGAASASAGGFGQLATVRQPGFQHLQRTTNPAVASRSPDRLRRFGVWWGDRPAEQRSAAQSTLALAPRGGGQAHQLQRIDHASEGTSSIGFGDSGPSFEPDHLQPVRQQRVGVLRQPPGGPHPGAELRGGSSVVLASSQRQSNQGYFSARNSQRGRRHGKSVVHRREGVSVTSGAISKIKPGVGTLQHRRLRVEGELSDEAVLVSVQRPGYGRPRRTAAKLVVSQPVPVPALRAHSPHFVTAGRLARHISHDSRATLADSTLVASNPVNDVGGGGLGLRERSDTASDETDADAARAYMEDGGVSALREVLQLQGYHETSVRRIVGRYEMKETKSTLARHQRTWDRSYIPWCADNAVLNPYSYDVVRFTNYLVWVQDKYEADQNERGVAQNHAMFKHARAALGAFMQLFHPDKPPVADHPHLQHIAKSLRVTAPNLPRYSETISLDPIFAALIKAYKDGARHEDVDIKNLRDWTIVLLRIRCKCRSADAIAINWIWTDDPSQSAIAGLHGVSPRAAERSLNADFQTVSVQRVRYDFPKNFRSRARMSEWKDLGPYLRDRAGFREEYSLCCARHALNVLLQRTMGLPAAPFVDPLRPAEHIPRVFLSVVRAQGRYFPIQASTAASLVKAILKALGFDVTKFKAHILRSASIVAGVQAGEHVDNVLQAASVSKKVFSIFYDLPILSAPPNPVDSSVAGQAAAINVISSSSNVPDTMGSTNVLHFRAPTGQQDASGAFAPLRLANRAAM